MKKWKSYKKIHIVLGIVVVLSVVAAIIVNKKDLSYQITQHPAPDIQRMFYGDDVATA